MHPISSWILNWLSEHPYSKSASQFSVSTTITRGSQRLTGEGLDAKLPPVYFLPAPGIYCARKEGYHFRGHLAYFESLRYKNINRHPHFYIQEPSRMAHSRTTATFFGSSGCCTRQCCARKDSDQHLWPFTETLGRPRARGSEKLHRARSFTDRRVRCR